MIPPIDIYLEPKKSSEQSNHHTFIFQGSRQRNFVSKYWWPNMSKIFKLGIPKTCGPRTNLKICIVKTWKNESKYFILRSDHRLFEQRHIQITYWQLQYTVLHDQTLKMLVSNFNISKFVTGPPGDVLPIQHLIIFLGF